VLGPAEEAIKCRKCPALESAGHFECRPARRAAAWTGDSNGICCAESGPLMLNHLWRRVFCHQPMSIARGPQPAAVGIFSAGIKYTNGLNVIPAYFTAAIFPLMSRYAHAGNDSLVKAVSPCAPVVFMARCRSPVFFTFAATPLDSDPRWRRPTCRFRDCPAGDDLVHPHRLHQLG